MEDTNMEDGDYSNRDSEVAPALLAVHPSQQSIAVALGSDLRVFNLQEGRSVSLVDETGECLHKDSIRAIRYAANGKLFVSAGDDKLVKIWSTDSWHCIATLSSEKRVSAVAVSNDGRFVSFADKFGVVYAIDTEEIDGKHGSPKKKAVPVLAHYCSIITCLEFSPDGKFIVSADRDFKIRVTVFPRKPLDGAHEIQSFCLGHTEFVSCLAFVSSKDCEETFLVSGSGDSTVRAWDYTSGYLLDTCDVGRQAGFVQSNGREEESLPAVTDICPTSDGSLIAVAIQSLSGVMLLSWDLSVKKLSVAKVISIPGGTFVPTSLGAAISEPLLWMIIGVSGLHLSDSPPLSRVRVVSGFCKSKPESADLTTSVMEDAEVPGGELLLETLQGKLSVEEEVFSTAAEAVKTAMRNLFTKKQYSSEKRELRKRGRNDKKGKE